MLGLLSVCTRGRINLTLPLNGALELFLDTLTEGFFNRYVFNTSSP